MGTLKSVNYNLKPIQLYEYTVNIPVLFPKKIGVEIKFKNCQYPVMIQPNKVPELNVLKRCIKGLIVGAAVTIDNLENELKKLIDNMPGKKFKLKII